MGYNRCFFPIGNAPWIPQVSSFILSHLGFIQKQLGELDYEVQLPNTSQCDFRQGHKQDHPSYPQPSF